MNDVAKAGDMALVVGARHKAINGQIVAVLSNPHAIPAGTHCNFGVSPDGPHDLKVPPEEADMLVSRYAYGHIEWVIRTSCLIPLRGSPDALTVETSEGRSVKA